MLSDLRPLLVSYLHVECISIYVMNTDAVSLCGITWCHVYHQWYHMVSCVPSMVSRGVICCINGVTWHHVLHQWCHVVSYVAPMVPCVASVVSVSCVASLCHFLHRGVMCCINGVTSIV